VAADEPITDLLDAWAEGDREALDELMQLVYSDLRASARLAMARERKDHTLEPTALVNEVFLRLVHLKKVSWESRLPFFAFAARLMRRILVEHARASKAKKRGGTETMVTLEPGLLPVEAKVLDILILDEALKRIEAVDPRMLRMIELRFFIGLSEEEIAEVLRTSRSSIQRDWAVAKRFLIQLLDGLQPSS
jgi:RNA polymerase sigma factor (TIGR02999 family)